MCSGEALKVDAEILAEQTYTDINHAPPAFRHLSQTRLTERLLEPEAVYFENHTEVLSENERRDLTAAHDIASSLDEGLL
jgi:hypothetical protein